MDKLSVILLLAIIAAFFITILIAWRFSEQPGNARSPFTSPVPRLRAEPGTMRENARPIVTSGPAPTQTEEAQARDDARRRLATWTDSAPERTSPATAAKEAAARLAGEALNATSIVEGIERVLENLANQRREETRAILYTTLGRLYARAGDLDSMNTAFEAARHAAQSQAERHDAQYHHAQALLDHGDLNGALNVIQQDTPNEEPSPQISPRQLQMGVIEGIALERLGRLEDAAQAYEAVMRDAIAHGSPEESGTANVFRQAGLHLSRVYNQLGRTAEVQRVRRDIRAWLE